MTRPESATSLGRRPLPRWVLGAILLAELADVVVIVLVAQSIGFARTALLLIFMALLGVWIIARQGSRTVRRMSQEAYTQSSPGTDMADGALIVLAGVLFFVPGFVGDVIGALLLVPPVRALVRRSLGAYLVKHVMVVGPVGPAGPRSANEPPFGPPGSSGPTGAPGGRGASGGGSAADDIIEGEIL